jgi:hypothetical protein
MDNEYGYKSFTQAWGSFVDQNTYDGMIGKTFRIMGEDYKLEVTDRGGKFTKVEA